MASKKKIKSKKRKLQRKVGPKRRKKQIRKPTPRRKRVLRVKKSRWRNHRGPSIKSGLKPKKIKNSNKSSFSQDLFPKTKIKVIGIGGGGGSIVSEIGKSLTRANFIIADTDFRALRKNSRTPRFFFGQELTHGLGTGMNPDLAKESAQKEKEKIAKILKGQDIVVLVACLGGGVGSGATPVFAEIAKNCGCITFGIFTFPFKFEGGKKSKIANNAIQSLKDSLSASITIPNERIFKIIDDKTSITEAFSAVNKTLIDSLQSLIEIIYNPGIINIDFADVRTILKGTGKIAFLNSYQARGKNAAAEIIKNIFLNPLYSYNLNAEKILFNVAGSNNLSMVDVEKISNSIAVLNPKAKIIFGISKNSKYRNKIKATLLVTGSGRFSKVVKRTEEKKSRWRSPDEVVDSRRSRNHRGSSIKSGLRRPGKTGKGTREKTPLVIKKIKESKEQKLNIVENPVIKKTKIRRNAIEIKKAEEMEENKKLVQEKIWEIPAFLRRIKG